MEIEVSVIVPIHGVGKFLNRCLDTLDKQSFELPYEVICVSDNCCDNSDEIIDSFVKKSPNKFVKLEVCNKNLSDTRNDGLKIAKGKYILFVDGDDSVLKDYIQSLYYSVVKEELDIGCCNYYEAIEDKDCKFKKNITSYLAVKKESNIEKTKKEFSLDVRLRSFVWNKIYKKDFLIQNDIKFNKAFVLCEDFVFNFLCFNFTNKNVGFSNNREYVYLQRRVSYTKTINNFKIIDGLINAITFVKASELLGNNFSTFNQIYFSKKFLLKYFLNVNKKSLSNYKEKKKEYVNKFNYIIKTNNVDELNSDIVNIYKKTKLKDFR